MVIGEKNRLAELLNDQPSNKLLWAHKTSPQSCSGEDKLPSQVIKDLATVYKEFIASPAQKELEELKK
ncbi:MAG: hypothetical protein GY853_14225, partial [PVC group bacterium]|nr:hypothetical protein [PVC group bacterium]